MKKLAIVAAAVLLSTQAAAVDAHIKVAPSFGCVSKVTFERVMGYVMDGDEEALAASMYVALKNGNCAMFEEGEGVFISDYSGVLVKVRKKGDTQSHWTYITVLK